ncbi:MAG: 50S ribosomal protein L25 [Dehalococcoidia bacterium]|nr:50S ribosomal protein L25 [Dehalococcoidia bacterium]
MAEKSFIVTTRTISGKKTRFLRREGITPAHLFGQGLASVAVQCPTGELRRAIALKGTTRLMDLRLDDEKETRSVFIREIQRDALSGELVHVDFYQVNKKRKIRVAVPLVLVGDAPASKLKNNIIEQLMSEVEVESLPGELPPQIEVDITSLAEANQALCVSDVITSSGVVIMAAPEQLIVKVSTIAEEKVAETAAAEAAEAGKSPVEAAKAEKSEKK